VRWGQWRERVEGLAVILADGSVLRVEDWQFAGDELVVPESPTRIWQAARWPREAVKGFVFQWPGSAHERDRLLARLVSADQRQDEVWLEGGDRLQGTLQWSTPQVLNDENTKPADDVADESNKNRWQVRTQAGDVPVARERVIAVALRGRREGGAEKSPAVGAWLATRDGSCFRALSVSRRDELVELELAGGVRLVCDAASLWDELRYVQPLQERTTYVSDLEPIGFKHIPYLSQSWSWGRDRSVSGGLLRSGGGVYRKGLGMHSSSRLAYDLGDGHDWLCAELAIDERAGQGGSVIFRVYSDSGDGQWKAIYESPVARGGQQPVPIRVDIRSARRLALIVDFADRGDELDHANWLDARLIREKNNGRAN